MKIIKYLIKYIQALLLLGMLFSCSTTKNPTSTQPGKSSTVTGLEYQKT